MPDEGQEPEAPQLPDELLDAIANASLRSHDVDAAIAELCSEHPEWADAIRAHVAEASLPDTVAATLRLTPQGGETAGVAPTIGPYRILHQVGEGGMGAVFLAEQLEPVRRMVALKVIKLGMDSQQVIRRFERERRALAAMRHTNIATVFDAGKTESGQPYFVMEYIDGLPITDYCQQQSLSLSQRIRLFQQICAGVQHAHQKGIVHRDLKPGNILVAAAGDEAVPKILDFGLAKAIEGEELGQSLMTEAGMILGTPEYMAPEQANATTPAVDTRTDVYALGVILYELLAGELPFSSEDLRIAGSVEMMRLIGEVEPQLPSARAHRTAPSSRIARELRGDLDWIIMMAMAKEPERRYATPVGLAEDLGRYLDLEPVKAGPPSASYRLRKFVLRNRAQLTAGALVVIASLLFGSIALVQKWRADQTSDENAELARRESEARSESERQAYTAHLAAADIAIANHDVIRARQQLDACAEPTRSGWEWLRLNAATDGSCALLRHDPLDHGPLRDARFDHVGSAVMTIAETGVRSIDLGERTPRTVFANDGYRVLDAIALPDEELVLTSSQTGDVQLWSARPNSLRATLKAFGDTPVRATIGPLGRRVLVRYRRDPKPRIWEIEGSRVVGVLRGYDSEVSSMAFSDDGKRVATVAGSTTRIWDASDGTELAALPTGTAIVNGVEFHPDGQHVITCSDEETATIWSLAGERRETVLRGHRNWVTHAAFSPDGKHVVTASLDMTLRLWNAESGSLQATLAGHTRPIASIAFDRTGNRLVTTGEGQRLRVWDLAACLDEPQIPPDTEYRQRGLPVPPLRLSPDGRLAVRTSLQRSSIDVWETTTWQKTAELQGHEHPLTAAAFPLDGKRIATASNDNTARIWHADSGKQLLRLKHARTVESVAFSPGGDLLLTTSSQLTTVWDANSGKRRFELLLEGSARSAVFHPDGNTILAASGDATARLFDTATGKEKMVLRGHTQPITTAIFDASGSRILTIVPGDEVRLWNAETGATLASCLTPEYGSTTAFFDRSGSLVAVPLRDKSVRILTAATGETVATLAVDQEISPLCFSPDGARLFAGQEREVGIWDPVGGKQLATLRGHRHGLLHAVFAPGTTDLLTTSYDQETRFWHARPLRDRYPEIAAIRRAMAEIEPQIRSRVAAGADLQQIRTTACADETMSDTARTALLIVTQRILDER